jgi:hypothetical protein
VQVVVSCGGFLSILVHEETGFFAHFKWWQLIFAFTNCQKYFPKAVVYRAILFIFATY